MLKGRYRFPAILIFILSVALLNGCASKQRSPETEAARLENISRNIDRHERWAADYEEIGSQEMAQYHREMADKERERYHSNISEPAHFWFEVLLDVLFD